MNRQSQSQLSPKSLASAIGVSESSMKRWIDQGQLPVHITSGGHRRISFSDAIKFIRAHKRTIVDPSALGLGGSEGAHSGINQSELVDILKTGDSAHLSNSLLQLYLSGYGLPTLDVGAVLLNQHRTELGDDLIGLRMGTKGKRNILKGPLAIQPKRGQ